MQDPHDLERFVSAQAAVIDAVREELRGGRKRTHWMWFVFPQLRGLGSSAMAQRYAIGSRAEAEAYLDHPVLGRRLVECTALANAVPGRDVHQVFGAPDDVKFHSCVTLFDALGREAVFGAALARFFGGARDARTLALLA